MNHRLVLRAAVVSAAMALAGCATAAGPTAAAPSPARDTAAACTAQVAANAIHPPGLNPDGPRPSAPEMQAYAATVEPHLAVVAQNAPDSLNDSLVVLKAQVDGAKQGQPIDIGDPAGLAASNAVNGWVHESCGFQTLNVESAGGELRGVPSALRPGPVAARFTNSGPPESAGFVLLLARVRDGQSVTLDDLTAGRVQFDQVADVLSGALPVPDGVGYLTATLTPGRYLLASPTGTPPDFDTVRYAELSVGES
ncbi:hypothetical protein ACFQE5_04230 [Pseudonocardia hispaniensis]|uniref:Lipoprotein n=1 Tax=Pseudonocardia hispaniensis TaxID=904933 RepID=A0ABW1IY70_9PSEU